MLLTTIHAQDHVAMQETGATLAPLLRRQDVLLLYGDLGAGKTTLSRGLIQRLTGDNATIVSPTFTLVQHYDTASGPLWHYDLYRLPTGRPEIIQELGWDDGLMDAITLVEWPERLHESLIPETALKIKILPCDQGGRQLEYWGNADWAKRLSSFN